MTRVGETAPAVLRAAGGEQAVAPVAARSLSSRWRAGGVEIGALLVLVLLYNTIRAGAGDDVAAAFRHARWLVDLEGQLVQDLEAWLNRGLNAVPPLAVVACYLYALLHYAVTPLVLLLSRRRGGWPYWRGFWTIVIASAIALAIYALWPLAPPRLVPSLGIVDVMREYAEYGWWGDAASAPRGIGDATNQYAAMPSMHCGWALWCGMQMWGFGSHAWRVAAVVYPSLTAVVVVATGNHFVLDIVGGAACVLGAHFLLVWWRARSSSTGWALEVTGDASSAPHVPSQRGPR